MWKDIKKRLDSSESYISLALGLAVVLMLGTLVYNYFTKRPTTTEEEQKAQEATQEAVTGTPPTKHTVAAGETLWSIAEKYYKSGYNWVDIQKANNMASADSIEVGQSLDIPQVTPIVPSSIAAATGPTGQVSGTSTDAVPSRRTYTVKPGDYLWKIAIEQYQDGYKWVQIAKENNLANPDLIYPDTVLVLP